MAQQMAQTTCNHTWENRNLIQVVDKSTAASSPFLPIQSTVVIATAVSTPLHLDAQNAPLLDMSQGK